MKPRWTKNTLIQHSFLASCKDGSQCPNHDSTKLKRARALFDFHTCLTLAGDDDEKLDSIVSGLDMLKSELLEESSQKSLNTSQHRADRFVGPIPDNEVRVLNPNISRNKGCGSRIKSSRELSMEQRKKRKCSNCNQLVRHNARTCPMPKKSDHE